MNKNVDPKKHTEQMLMWEADAQMKGKRLGQQYQGDPWRAAAGLGLPVIREDLSWKNVLGDYDPLQRCIRLHNRQSPHEADRTLAHEIAHHVLGHKGNTWENERYANGFMNYFLAQQPEPPGAAWARIQEKLYDRQRRAMRTRAQLMQAGSGGPR